MSAVSFADRHGSVMAVLEEAKQRQNNAETLSDSEAQHDTEHEHDTDLHSDSAYMDDSSSSAFPFSSVPAVAILPSPAAAAARTLATISPEAITTMLPSVARQLFGVDLSSEPDLESIIRLSLSSPLPAAFTAAFDRSGILTFCDTSTGSLSQKHPQHDHYMHEIARIRSQRSSFSVSFPACSAVQEPPKASNKTKRILKILGPEFTEEQLRGGNQWFSDSESDDEEISVGRVKRAAGGSRTARMNNKLNQTKRQTALRPASAAPRPPTAPTSHPDLNSRYSSANGWHFAPSATGGLTAPASRPATARPASSLSASQSLSPFNPAPSPSALSTQSVSIPPSRSARHRVNEALRQKLSQLEILRSEVEKRLQQLQSDHTLLKSLQQKLSFLDQRVQEKHEESVRRVDFWTRQKPLLDAAGDNPLSESDRQLTEAFHHAVAQSQSISMQIRHFFARSNQLLAILVELRTELKSQANEISGVMAVDQECLNLEHQMKITKAEGQAVALGQGQNTDYGSGSAFATSSASSVALSDLDRSHRRALNFPLIQKIFERVHDLRQSITEAAHLIDHSLNQFTSDLKSFQRSCSLSLRQCAQESSTTRGRFLQQIHILKATLTARQEKEKELTQRLNMLVGPLKVCQSTYQLRLKNPDPHMATEILQGLELEFMQLSNEYQWLESEISANRREIEAIEAEKRIAKDRVYLEEKKVKFYSQCIRIDGKATQSVIQSQYSQRPNTGSTRESVSVAELLKDRTGPLPPFHSPGKSKEDRMKTAFIRDLAAQQERIRTRKVQTVRGE